MEIVSTRNFRQNQTAILSKVIKGESVALKSRMGIFKIVPMTEADFLASRISQGMKEVELIESGELPAKSARDFLNEL